jgi:hypothetical protein
MQEIGVTLSAAKVSTTSRHWLADPIKQAAAAISIIAFLPGALSMLPIECQPTFTSTT